MHLGEGATVNVLVKNMIAIVEISKNDLVSMPVGSVNRTGVDLQQSVNPLESPERGA